MERQPAYDGNMFNVNVQQVEPIEHDLLWDDLIKSIDQFQLTQANFNCHLPQTGRTDQFLVTGVLNQCACSAAEPLIALDEVEKAMRVEDEFHHI
jgi:hypothetical protein